MKKLLSLMPVILAVLTLLSGCGGSSNVTMDMATKEEAAVEMPASGNSIYTSSSVDTDAAVSSQQKLIKTVRMDTETEDLEALLPLVGEKIAALGGYIENQEIYNGSSQSSYRYRSANLTVRIPAENLDGFVEKVKGFSNVTSYNESTENVTLQYVATESRMKALEVEQERLLELLAQAENMSDLLEIEARLTDVRYELESVTSQLRVLANQVDYATVYLYISQVRVYTEVVEQTVWQRIGTGFRENLHGIGEDLKDLFVWTVTYSPQLVFLALVAAAAVTVLRRRTAKQRADKEADKKAD